jgi:bacillithiol biosynthesis deacetylase BshB1
MSDFLVDALCVAPHPDDAEIFCGGSLIRLQQLGHSTAVVDLTRGERGTHGTPELRAREAEAAAQVMGLSFRENLALPDAAVDARDDGQVSRVVEMLRRRRPELLLIPWIEDRHPDHAEAGRLLQRAVFLAGLKNYGTPTPSERFVPGQVLHYQLRHRFVPSFIFDTSAASARKAEAVACYASQFHRPATDPVTLIGSPGAYAAIEARDRYFGSMIGVSHGEAFRAPSVPGLVDPLRHFRDNPFRGAHAFEPLS